MVFKWFLSLRRVWPLKLFCLYYWTQEMTTKFLVWFQHRHMFDFFFFFLMLLWTFSKMRTRWSRCGGDQGLKGQEWVLGSVVYQGAHCISEERVGALHLIRQRLLTSEWWSWRNADITHGSFGSFLIASSWSQAHCFNPLFCTALSHSFHSIKVYENCYLDL